MKTSMGPIVLGAALPHPDTSDTRTLEAGVVKRIATTMPVPDKVWMEELGEFVDEWLHTNCTPLSPDVDLSFETWIEERPYPAWRKEELKQVHGELVAYTLLEKYRKVKLFMKDEDYPEFKHGRGIYARCDQFKVLFGPLCSKIEEDMYSKPEFIKHVPVADRPAYMMAFLKTCGDPTGTTDFTSFECSFTAEVQKYLDQRMFKFYCSRLKNSFLRKIYESLTKMNHVVNKHFSFDLMAKRMSGEMNTSLSNGFANLMVNLFLAKKLNLGVMRICVEGDDGISKTSSGKFPSPEDYAKLGFNIKIQVHEDPAAASFCGIVYDVDDLNNVTNPLEVLAQFGWTTGKYAGCRQSKLKTLLRCKSLCYLYQYPGCPIIQELALYGLRMTKSHDVKRVLDKDRHIGYWERNKLLQASQMDWRTAARPIGNNTRMLVERLYNVSVETQLSIEKYLREKTTCDELVIEQVVWPAPWCKYFENYCFENPIKSPNLIGKYPAYVIAEDLGLYVNMVEK